MAYGRSAAGLSPQTARQRPEINMRRRDGHILVWVLGLLLVASVLSAAVLTFALSATRSTEIGHNTQQARFTAKSAAGAAAQHIISNALSQEEIEAFIGKTGKGGTAQMGEYTVTMQFVTADQLKITAIGKYKGQNVQESVTLVRGAASAPSGIPPTDKLLYVGGNIAVNNQLVMQGDLYADGDISLAQSSVINGNLVTKGKVQLGGSAVIKKDIFSFGGIQMTGAEGGSTVEGSIYTVGDYINRSNLQVWGNVLAKGNMIASGGRIGGNATIGGYVKLSGGGARVQGSLTSGQTITRETTDSDALNVLAPGVRKENTPFVGINASAYEVVAPQVISVPNLPELQTAIKVSKSTRTINKSGLLSNSSVSDLDWGSSVIIDATQKDIHLLIKDSYQTYKGLKYFVRVNTSKKYNVYIYLTGSASLSLDYPEVIAMENSALKPRIYIIGDGNQRVQLNNGEINGFIYMPAGKFIAGGSPPGGRYLYGFAIVKEIDIGSKIPMVYCVPDLDGTPLEDIASSGGGSGTGGTSWTMGAWSGK